MAGRAMSVACKRESIYPSSTTCIANNFIVESSYEYNSVLSLPATLPSHEEQGPSGPIRIPPYSNFILPCGLVHLRPPLRA